MDKFESFKKYGDRRRIDDPEVIESIREQFANEWEELVTGPDRVDGKDFDYVEMIRRGEKVPRSDRWLYDKLVSIAQDHHLSPSEIEILKDMFLE